jgi:hypothetical protein
MTNRFADSVVTFKHPFTIGTHGLELPAGAYRLTVEEELIEGLSFAAFRQTSTTLEVPAIGVASAIRQYLNVTSDDLDAALNKDSGRTEPDAS